MTEIRLCRDCRHASIADANTIATAICPRPWLEPVWEYVLGQHRYPRPARCEELRLKDGECGPEGKFWEAK